MSDDPDETEGRKLYRQQANTLASAQVNIAKKVKKLTQGTPHDEAAERQVARAMRVYDAQYARFGKEAALRAVLALAYAGVAPKIDEAGLQRARSEAMRRGDVAFNRADAIVRAYLGIDD